MNQRRPIPRTEDALDPASETERSANYLGDSTPAGLADAVGQRGEQRLKAGA